MQEAARPHLVMAQGQHDTTPHPHTHLEGQLDSQKPHSMQRLTSGLAAGEGFRFLTWHWRAGRGQAEAASVRKGDTWKEGNWYVGVALYFSCRTAVDWWCPARVQVPVALSVQIQIQQPQHLCPKPGQPLPAAPSSLSCCKSLTGGPVCILNISRSLTSGSLFRMTPGLST